MNYNINIEITGNGAITEILTALESLKESLIKMSDSELSLTLGDKTLCLEVCKEEGKTEGAYEEWLNDHYNDMDQEHAIDSVIYLTNSDRGRGKYISEVELRLQCGLGLLGTVVKQLDSISFYAGYRDWNPR